MKSQGPRAGAEAKHNAALQRRCARELRRLGVLAHPQSPVIVACSGGPDSAALLSLLAASVPGLKLLACYVDHGLRARAAIRRDVAAVRAQARQTGAAVVVRSVAGGFTRAASREAQARTLRYGALLDVAREQRACFVLTAHHADDVAETALLALARGSGLDGLSAIAPRRALGSGAAGHGIVTLARPVLFATRAELKDWLTAHPVRTSLDETNDDTSIRRNAVRRLLAQMEDAAPGTRRNIARAVRLVRGDRAMLDRLAQRAFERSVATRHKHALAARDLRSLSRPLLRRVVRLALRHAVGSTRGFSGPQCESIINAIKQGRGGTYQAGDARVLLSAGVLRISAAQVKQTEKAVRHAVSVPQRLSGAVNTPWGVLTFDRGASRAAKNIAPFAATLFLDPTQLQQAACEVRLPRPGDKCIPAGRRSAVPLARFLAKAGIPQDRRSRVALLCAENRIAAVLGLRATEPYAARPGGRSIAVRWQPVTNADNGSIKLTATEGAPESFYE